MYKKKEENPLVENIIHSFILKVSKNKILRLLLYFTFGFAILNLIAIYTNTYLNDFPFRELFFEYFHVDNETSFPTFYSVYSLQACSLLLAIIAYITNKNEGKFVKHWKFLAYIFLFLSFDEALSFHEKIAGPLRKTFDLTGYFYFAWVIPALFLLIVFFIVYLKFILHLPKKISKLFLLSGTLYIFGALIMEILGGKVKSAIAFGNTDLAYLLMVSIEEFFEMLGIAIFIYALLSCLQLKLIQRFAPK